MEVKMLILLKHDTKKYAYDTKSGAAVPLSSLQYKVAENVDLPLKPVCPTTLRYQLAKYDSADVKRAYAYLYELYESKIINEDTDDNTANLLLVGEYGVGSAELGKEMIDTIRGRMGNDTQINLIGDCDFSEEIKSYI